MPIDSRAKRASTIQIWKPFVMAPVTPDGTIEQGDRQHIAYSYSGILAAGAPQVYYSIPTIPSIPSIPTIGRVI